MRNGLANLDIVTCLWLHRVQEKAVLTRINRWISRSGDGHFYMAIAAALLMAGLISAFYAQFVLLA